MLNKDKMDIQKLSGIKGEISISPIPSPEILEKYEKIQSGTLDRILKMAEKEQEKRHSTGDEILSQNKQLIKDSNGLQILSVGAALLISLTTIVAGAILTYYGKNIEGIVAMLTPLIGLTGIFLTGKYLQSKNKK